MLIVDTAPMLSPLESDTVAARAVADALARESEVPILPLTVAAELDYMITTRGGRGANVELLRDLADGRFHVPCLEAADYATIGFLNDQYRDLDVGLTDLSIVVMAARYRTRRILTFDQKHFRALRPLQGGAFVLVPFDE